MRSNCVLWARCRHRALLRQWRTAGSPKGTEPVLRKRPTRLEPQRVCGLQVLHWEVEHWDGQHWVREGWVPLDPRPLPWWLLWRALWAEGAVRVEVIR